MVQLTSVQQGVHRGVLGGVLLLKNPFIIYNLVSLIC